MADAIGCVERVTTNSVIGWARNPDDPTQRVTVGLVAQGVVVSKVAASLLRPDLAAVGVEEGRCGFELPVPLEIQQHPQAVSILVLELNEVLPFVPAEEPVAPLVGSIDMVSADAVEGWAWDPDRPNAVVTCVLEIEGAPIARQMATIHRADLVLAGVGDGNHGFRFVLPDEWRQGSIRINVRVEELNRNLTPEPVLRIPSLYGLERAVEQHRIHTFGPMKASCFSPTAIQKHFQDIS